MSPRDFRESGGRSLLPWGMAKERRRSTPEEHEGGYRAPHEQGSLLRRRREGRRGQVDHRAAPRPMGHRQAAPLRAAVGRPDESHGALMRHYPTFPRAVDLARPEDFVDEVSRSPSTPTSARHRRSARAGRLGSSRPGSRGPAIYEARERSRTSTSCFGTSWTTGATSIMTLEALARRHHAGKAENAVRFVIVENLELRPGVLAVRPLARAHGIQRRRAVTISSQRTTAPAMRKIDRSDTATSGPPITQPRVRRRSVHAHGSPAHQGLVGRRLRPARAPRRPGLTGVLGGILRLAMPKTPAKPRAKKPSGTPRKRHRRQAEADAARRDESSRSPSRRSPRLARHARGRPCAPTAGS